MLAKKRQKIAKNIKTPKQMERHLKGVANHNRIGILLIVGDNQNITLDSIIEEIKGNPKTIGEHTRRLCQAGLINKKQQGNFVEHTLSPYGRIFFKFLKAFQEK